MRLTIAAATCVALGTIGLAAPAASASPAAGWTTHVFQVTYDGSGDVRYHAAGPNGDTGCYMSVDGTDSYSFGQLWTIRISFRHTGPGTFATKIVSIRHVDGPQGGAGSEGKSGLGGEQTVAPNASHCVNANTDDTGHFSCTAKNPLLFAIPNPQMKLIRKGKNLQAQSVAFADGFWTYGGSDTIPSDKANGGCSVYSDTDLTFGAGIFIGSDSITNLSIPVRELANLAKRHVISAPVHFGKNTLHPKQTKCTAVFAAPSKCVIHSQALNAKFTLTRIK